MSQRKHWFIIVLIIMTIFLSRSSFSYAQDGNPPQVILVLINQMSFLDEPIYRDLPGFRELNKFGAIGAMNINSGASRSDSNSYLTIGGGTRGAGNDLGQSRMLDEIEPKTLKEFILPNRLKGTQKETILFLSINDLYKEKQKFNFTVGALGSILAENKLSSKVFGNNDYTEKIRYAPLITMDKYGVSYGDIGKNSSLIDKKRPFQVKSNYSFMLQELETNKDTSLIVFDLGDLYRLEKSAMNLEEKKELKPNIYQEMGTFISQIMSKKEQNQTLIVLSPMVNPKASQERYLLSPIWMYEDNQKDSFLTSNTTRRRGIVANTDIAPTILDRFGINKPKNMLGESINIVKGNLNLNKELEHIAVTYKNRAPVLYSHVMWQVFILILGIVILLNKGLHLNKQISVLLISLLYLPLLLLFTAIFTPENLYVYVISLLLISILLGYLTNKLEVNKAFIIIGFLTFASLTLDVVFNGYLIKRSFLGYDPIIGARYYGIGNEFMGVYIGSALLFTSALHQKKNYLTIGITTIIYAILWSILLYPTLGTNFGGAISAVIATGITYMNLMGLSWNKRTFMLLILLVFTGFGSIIALNYFTSIENQSHIGKALNELFNGNLGVILQTMQRKLSMNWKLIQVSSWSKVMITSIIAIGVLFLTNSFKELKKRFQSVFYGFYGIVIGAFVSLLVNDSGVIAASTMIIYVAVPILYIALLEQQELED